MRKLLKIAITPGTIILIAVLARLLPHPPNFAPIAALALFGGVYLDRRYAIILPLAAMFLADIFIGFDFLPITAAIYGSFILAGFIGIWLREHKNFVNVSAASLTASILFFIITNFAVWAFSPLYAKDFFGLVQSYTMAIPFFRNTLLGDLFYTGVFFGGFELVKSLASGKFLARSPAQT